MALVSQGDLNLGGTLASAGADMLSAMTMTSSAGTVWSSTDWIVARLAAGRDADFVGAASNCGDRTTPEHFILATQSFKEQTHLLEPGEAIGLGGTAIALAEQDNGDNLLAIYDRAIVPLARRCIRRYRDIRCLRRCALS